MTRVYRDLDVDRDLFIDDSSEAVFLHRHNDFCHLECTVIVPLRRIVVWGGLVANMGEDVISSLLRDHAESVEEFVYFPAHTKGGNMLRPLYYKSDRCGIGTFPRLRRLQFALHMLVHVERLFLYDAPIEELSLLIDPALCVCSDMVSRHMHHQLQRHSASWRDPNGFCAVAFQHFPTLQRITAVLTTIKPSGSLPPQTKWESLLRRKLQRHSALLKAANRDRHSPFSRFGHICLVRDRVGSVTLVCLVYVPCDRVAGSLLPPNCLVC